MLTIEDITAIILSGGQGSRVNNHDKGLISYRDKPLISHVIDKISPQVDNIVISCNRNTEIYAKYGFPIAKDLENTNNSVQFEGPLAGIQAGLNQIKTQAAIIVPCDNPNIPPILVKRLITAVNQYNKLMATPNDGHRIQPLYSLLTLSAKEPLDNFLKSGQRKAEFFFLQQGTLKVDFSDCKEHFLNLNTLESLDT